MSNIMLEYINSLHPAIWAGFLLPLLAAVVLWVKFYSHYDAGGLKKLSLTLKSINQQEASTVGVSRENIEILERGLNKEAPACFRAAWERMQRDLGAQYRGDFIPEAGAYFDLESLVLIPGGRKSVASLWGLFGIFALLSLISPALAFFFTGGSIPPMAYVFGIWGLFNLCVGQMIFVLADLKAFQTAIRDYDRFIRLFNGVIPVAGTLSGAALLLEATQRNQAVFQASADRIASKFDTFSSDVVLPALRASTALIIEENLVPAVERIETSLNAAMDAFSLRHDEEMKTITDAFADKLSGTIETRIKSLGEMLGTVESGLSAINRQLENNLTGMDAAAKEQKLTLQQASDILNKAGEIQLAGNENHVLMNAGMKTLDETVKRMEETLSEFTSEAGMLWQDAGRIQKEQADELLQSRQMMIKEFNDSLTDFSHILGTAQEGLGKNVQDLQEQYAGLNHMINDMMLKITERINEAMSNAGSEIGKSIQGATADNAQAITDLTAQAARLRDDYDTYFGRLEDNTKQTLDDMDYHVQNITIKMTEEISAMLKNILEQNTQVLEQYKDNTTNLLQSFDEQARSISLYAKEMNYDITELSANMKESVALFTKQIQDGVNLSIAEFDSGLAELSTRIANTVETIADAVENLPAAMLGIKE